MSINKLEPMDIIRNEMGTWTHPVYSEYLANNLSDQEYITVGEWEDLKNHFNIDTVTFWMESCVNIDDWEEMNDSADISKWNPIAPNGFFLIDIHFGEDDAYAIFARNKLETELL
jgi:hypothetical protein